MWEDLAGAPFFAPRSHRRRDHSASAGDGPAYRSRHACHPALTRWGEARTPQKNFQKMADCFHELRLPKYRGKKIAGGRKASAQGGANRALAENQRQY
jgi:hypothetical protein